jgi:phenylacetic acid degradation operon negative regulatory protein
MTIRPSATMLEMAPHTTPTDGAVHLDALLADIRPLGARSVIASTLLGADAARLPAERLVRAGHLFGIADGAIRTALWRMVSAGELVAADGRYELAGRLLARQQRSTASASARRLEWAGTWELVVVEADRRPAAARHDLRRAAAALHLGRLREGVWGRPDNLDPARSPDHRSVVDAQCTTFRGAITAAPLIDRLFDLDGWVAGASTLIAALDAASHAPPELAPGALREGFQLSIAVVRHLDHDPLLPDELLPRGWPGNELRTRYLDYHRGYDRRFADWLRLTN